MEAWSARWLPWLTPTRLHFHAQARLLLAPGACSAGVLSADGGPQGCPLHYEVHHPWPWDPAPPAFASSMFSPVTLIPYWIIASVVTVHSTGRP